MPRHFSSEIKVWMTELLSITLQYILPTIKYEILELQWIGFLYILLFQSPCQRKSIQWLFQ